MSKEYPFPLWITDFFKKTEKLSFEERAAYLFLLMQMWRNGGSVPDDDQDNARLVGLSLKRWNKIKPRLIPFLERYGDPGSHRLTQKRVLEELAKKFEFSEIQRSRAVRSNESQKKRKQQLNLRLGDATVYATATPARTPDERQPLKENIITSLLEAARAEPNDLPEEREKTEPRVVALALGPSPTRSEETTSPSAEPPQKNEAAGQTNSKGYLLQTGFLNGSTPFMPKRNRNRDLPF